MRKKTGFITTTFGMEHMVSKNNKRHSFTALYKKTVLRYYT
jgi:hypothetical protein